MKLWKRFIKVFLIIFIFFIPLLSSDSIKTKNRVSSVYFELFGQGPILSINYDKHFVDKNISFRTGLGIFPIDNFYFTFPFGINYLFGKKHMFETNTGITVFLKMNENKKIITNDSKVVPTIGLGYRYQSEKDWFFRTGFTCYIGSDKFSIWPGISAGASF